MKYDPKKLTIGRQIGTVYPAVIKEVKQCEQLIDWLKNDVGMNEESIVKWTGLEKPCVGLVLLLSNGEKTYVHFNWNESADQSKTKLGKYFKKYGRFPVEGDGCEVVVNEAGFLEILL